MHRSFRRSATWLPLALLVAVASASVGLGPDAPGAEQVPPVAGFDRRAELQDALTAWRGGPREQAGTLQRATVPYLVLHLEFDTAQARRAACAQFTGPIAVVAQFEEFADVLVRKDTEDAFNQGIRAVNSADGLAWMDVGGDADVPPPPPDVQLGNISRGLTEPIVRGGRLNRTGRNVLIAVIDSGLDFRHPDFVVTGPNGEKTSRLLYLWDTIRDHVDGVGQPGPVTYPGGVPIGSVFSRDDLNRDLRAGDQRLGSTDDGGHGTACAGVAAGTGQALRDASSRDAALRGEDYRGVAPDAELIGVRIGARGRGLPNAWLLNAICGWIDERAAGRPVVISCSFGGHDGGHDGALILERQLARRLPADRPGRLVCVAAGNEGADGLHGVATFARDDDGRLTWDLKAPALIEIFIDPAVPGGAPLAKGDVTLKPTAGTKYAVRKPYLHGISQSLVLTLQAEAGSGGVYLTTTADRQLRADAYLFARKEASGPSGKFVGACAENSAQVATPATAGSVIAVGSYDFNDVFLAPRGAMEVVDQDTKRPLVLGSLSRYSNAGYLRRPGQVKPDVTAPGQFHIAPAVTATPDGLRDKSGRYRIFNGTSAAAPYVAGVAALLMERQPKLSANEFRALLQAHATKDGRTGDGPNPRWGYGKLDVAAVERMIRAMP